MKTLPTGLLFRLPSSQVTLPRRPRISSSLVTNKSETFSTYYDKQPGVLIQAYEGERAPTEDNNLRRKFELSGIPPAPRGVPQVEVTFDIDANDILDVSAFDNTTGKSNRITITNRKGRLSKEEIDHMVEDAERHRLRMRLPPPAYGEERPRVVCSQVTTCDTHPTTRNCSKNTVPVTSQKLDGAVNDAAKWLDASQEGSNYDGVQKELAAVANAILQELHGGQQFFKLGRHIVFDMKLNTMHVHVGGAA
ncbi:heat shock protein 70 kDa [Mycena polygramma]|nr:heat shock protein 70 kDa [Mycena polygramma]